MRQTFQQSGDIISTPALMAGNAMHLNNATDESLLAIYESVRRQVMAEVRLGGRRLAGNAMR